MFCEIVKRAFESTVKAGKGPNTGLTLAEDGQWPD